MFIRCFFNSSLEYIIFIKAKNVYSIFMEQNESGPLD